MGVFLPQLQRYHNSAAPAMESGTRNIHRIYYICYWSAFEVTFKESEIYKLAYRVHKCKKNIKTHIYAINYKLQHFIKPPFTVLLLLYYFYCITFTVLLLLYYFYCITFTVLLLLYYFYCITFTVLLLLYYFYCITFTVLLLLYYSRMTQS